MNQWNLSKVWNKVYTKFLPEQINETYTNPNQLADGQPYHLIKKNVWHLHWIICVQKKKEKEEKNHAPSKLPRKQNYLAWSLSMENCGTVNIMILNGCSQHGVNDTF